ncbi:MAG TPA: alginate export family protein, partial [Candidatus Omnitrophota bacterium]|nr:alginate export family protein [Candidatus Omnitrophota bacterium]
PSTSNSNDKRLAYAIQAMADYTFSKVKMTPMIGAAYTFLSGDKNNNTGKRAWNQMYYNQSLNNIAYAIIPFSNLSVVNIKGSVKPMDDVTVSLNYGWYRRAKKNTNAITSPATSGNEVTYASYVMNDKKALGNEIDLTVTYDYTEDVQLGLTGGWFKPGKAFDTVNRRDATQLIGSMKVTF